MKSSITIVLFLSLMMASCSKGGKKEDSKAYKTIRIEKGSCSLKRTYAAKFTGKQIVEIRPQVSGKITRICIKEGDVVKKGQTLFVIDQAPYLAALKIAEANVKSAEAQLATARLELETNENLSQSQIIGTYQVKASTNSLKAAEASLAQAQAQESNARNELSYTVVKSPLDGHAGMIPYHVGALVSANIDQPLVTVTDDKEAYAYFSITENQAMDLICQYGSMNKFIENAPAVELLLGNGKEYKYSGRIDAVSGIVDEGTGAVTLRAVFPNPDCLLHNGGTGTVVIPIQMEQCIVIPKTATYELQNRGFVYKVVDGVTRSQAIEVLSLDNGKEYVISQGLQEGDVIVAEGAGLVKDGIHVTVKEDIRK